MPPGTKNSDPPKAAQFILGQYSDQKVLLCVELISVFCAFYFPTVITAFLPGRHSSGRGWGEGGVPFALEAPPGGKAVMTYHPNFTKPPLKL